MAQSKSATYWSQRKTKQNGKLVRWERLLTVLGNGGVVSLQEIQDTMQYDNMYRIVAEILTLKYNGGVVRANKNGRNVIGYELINAQEMVAKFLTPRGFDVVSIVGRDANKIEKLSDLTTDVQPKATKTKKVKVEEDIEVTELTD
jgi:hypothetical protein